ncbi:MAG: hypothetical protein ACMG6S_08625, partial [Byssovorax sp.]
LLERAGYAARVAPMVKRATVAMDRGALVASAREARRHGRLALGEFLLDAGAIDAREEGADFDRARAGALYAARLGDLRLAAAKKPLRSAVPEVFGDLHYYGRAGGRVGDALIEGGGSCEPLAQLLAAALFDAGRAEGAGLRYYGGAGAIPHLTPVLTEGKKEIDLLSGRAALPGGARFAADELVEIYARAHDLAPKKIPADGSPEDGAIGDDAPAPAAPASMADGYPPNHDRYPGTTPLYAGRAVPEEAALAAAEEGKMPAADQAADCAFFVRLAALDPPVLTVGEGAEASSVELLRVPDSEQIDRIFARIAAVEQTLARPATPRPKAAPPPAVEQADRLMALACLTALYDRAAVDLTLTRATEIARASLAKRNQAADAGAKLLASIAWGSPAGEAVAQRLAARFSGRSWLLLVLAGGDAAALASLADRDDWGRVNVLAGLMIAPSTRARALALAEKLPRGQQIEVMHEVFHAHDHLRPWSSNYALDAGGEGEIPRAYRAFRGVAWGLWEGARSPEEVLSALRRDVEKERLDPSWEVALALYFAQNGLNLHRFRADSVEFSRALGRWLRDSGHTDLEIYRRLVAEVGLD